MASEAKTPEVNLKREAECLEPVISGSSAQGATEDRNKTDHKARQDLRVLVDKSRAVFPNS